MNMVLNLKGKLVFQAPGVLLYTPAAHAVKENIQQMQNDNSMMQLFYCSFPMCFFCCCQEYRYYIYYSSY